MNYPLGMTSGDIPGYYDRTYTLTCPVCDHTIEIDGTPNELVSCEGTLNDPETGEPEPCTETLRIPDEWD